LRHSADFFMSDALLHPAYSPRAFIETGRGVIEVQLELVNAPLTVATFIEQVRSGFFNGLRVHRLVPAFVMQTGDPRGDGTGGPGYTQRDEFSPAPYLRGTLGMATGGAETAGSQWFITLSPQPHLDARYTAFGRVVGGWDVLDQVAAGDVIERVRIWDGVELR
jgi:cyclophilin family peptidyl-prolyl cis-trans isomerase